MQRKNKIDISQFEEKKTFAAACDTEAENMYTSNNLPVLLWSFRLYIETEASKKAGKQADTQ